MKQSRSQALLRRSGYKATEGRLAVLNLLQKAKHPLSAKDVIDSLGDKIDQATVYRIIKALKKTGIIRQVDLRHNHAHYEIYREDEHHHLICSNCGTIEDVEECGLESMHSDILKNSAKFVEIKQHALEFYGTCRSCAKQRSLGK